MPEVFIIQLEGTKNWKVWKNYIKNPTYSMQEVLIQDELHEPEMDILLEPGDILYIPSGTPHIARCIDDYSLHMSIGIIPIKIHDVLELFIKILSQSNPVLRETIYPFTPILGLDEVKNKILDNLKNVKIEDMISEFKLMNNSYKHETSPYRLKSIVLGSKINSKSKLKLRIGHNIKIKKNEDKINVYYGSTIAKSALFKINPTFIELPDYCEDALNYLIKIDDKEFCPDDIVTLLDSESKVVLCQELINSGIINVINL